MSDYFQYQGSALGPYPTAGAANSPTSLVPYGSADVHDLVGQNNPWGDIGIPIGPGPIGGGPDYYNDPFPIPLPGGGGGGNDWLGGAIGWLEDVLEGFGFSWEDVADVISPLFGGGSGGEVVGGKIEKANALNKIFYQSAGLKQAFIAFLQAAGSALSWINSFINSPVPNWPVFLIDLALFWLQNGAPTNASQSGFQPAADMLGQGQGLGPTLPVPGGNMDLTLLAGTALMNPVMEAVPTMTYKAPKGYVTVTHPQTGQKLFVEKNLAYKAGLVKRRKKAPFTAKEWNTLRTAARVEEKVKRLSGKAFNKYKCVRK